MSLKLKPLDEQRVVITGASSGIGLETARRFAKAGARVLLVSRNGEALQAIVEDIRAEGGKAEYAVADAGDEAAVEAAANRAVELFGGIDTWVNDAGTSTYGDVVDLPLEEHRRIFDTNYFGVVNGSLAAVKRMREGGGAIINLGSVVSDFPSPQLAAYVASKHAIKGFTESLRIELMHDEAAIAVTLIKPSAINTPFKEHGKNRMGVAAALPPPVYQPNVVADAILHAARRPTREITVGAGGKLQALAYAVAPALSEKLFAAVGERLVQTPGQPPQSGDNLFGPGEDGEARSDAPMARGFSLYTLAQTHGGWVLGAGVAAGVLIATAIANERYGDDLRKRAKPYVRDARRAVKPYLREARRRVERLI